MPRVIVVGGGAAGMSTASRAKRLRPEYEVMVFERSGYVSYAPCGIPYYIGSLVQDLEDLVHYPVSLFREKRGIDVRVHAEVVDIDPGARKVSVREEGGVREYEYDFLVLATGARPIVPPIPGTDLDGVLTLRNLEDGERARRLLRGVGKVAVVGGGYIGVEVAENLARLGLRVMLFEMLPHVMPTLDHDMAELVEKELEANGVELHLSEKVVEINGRDGRVTGISTEKGRYEADLVFLAVGVQPDTTLAEKAGVRIGVTGAIEVDERMRTSDPAVYSVGDNTETRHVVTGKKTWLPLAPPANKMGYVAGTNIAGGNIRFPGVVGTAVTKAFNLEIGRTGLTVREAEMHGYDPVWAKITASTRAAYYPGARRMTVKLVADRETGRILGGQFVGEEGVLARLDATAALLWRGGTVKDAFFGDFAYAPPFAPVWDPLVVAARVLLKEIKG